MAIMVLYRQLWIFLRPERGGPRWPLYSKCTICEYQSSSGPAAMVFGKQVTIANTNAFSGGIWAIEYKFKLNNSYLFKNKGGNDPTKFSNKVC